jgi:glycosyltransferase involved in cell wall biosynthesis
MHHLKTLSQAFEHQIGEFPVEHLILMDNKRRTVGEKRDALLRAAKGNYVAFVDDDDFISPDYVSLILEKTIGGIMERMSPAEATVDGYAAEIEFRLGYQ